MLLAYFVKKTWAFLWFHTFPSGQQGNTGHGFAIWRRVTFFIKEYAMDFGMMQAVT
jgi:hypothetical protein